MLVSLVLIEGEGVDQDKLRSASLMNALQLVIGEAYGFGTILHINTDSSEYLGEALRVFAAIPNVTGVITLAIREQ